MRRYDSARFCRGRKKSQSGISLVETMIALCLLLIAAAGIMTMATVAMSTTENQGHLAARTAEYAQDKWSSSLPCRIQTTLLTRPFFPRWSALAWEQD